MEYKQQHPTENDIGACLRWLPWVPEKYDDPSMAAFMHSGYQLGVIKAAQTLGPILIARLISANLLRPDGDPVLILENLIADFKENLSDGK